MKIYEFLFETPKPKTKTNPTLTGTNNDEKPITYNDILSKQDLKNFNFNDRYLKKSEDYQKNRDELDNLKKYMGELNITGNRLTHAQKYTFKKLFIEFQKLGYSYNLSYALCLLFFEESKFDKKFGKTKTINPTTNAMGLTQWIRNRFANFVLFLREKTDDFKNIKPETLKKLTYFLKITEKDAENIPTNNFSVAIDKKNKKVTDEQIEKFNEILWSQTEMIDYQIEFFMLEFNSKFYKQRFKGLDIAARQPENQSKDIYSETPIINFLSTYQGPLVDQEDNKKETPVIPPITVIDEKTPGQLIKILTPAEKSFLNQVVEKFMVPGVKKNQTIDSISNERIKKGFEVLYNNITRRLDMYDLSGKHFKKDAYNYTEINSKKEQLEEIAKELEKNIEKNFRDYPFLDEIYEVKEGDLLSKIVASKGITWKSLVRYNLPFFVNYFKKRKDQSQDIYDFASKFYGNVKAKILIPKYNCFIVNSKEGLKNAAIVDNKTVEQLIKFNESELKETDKKNSKKQKIKEPIHVIDPECKHTQIIFLEKSNNKLSETLIKNYIKNILLEEKQNINKPYQQGDVNDMLLDEEGWTTDPDDRQEIKKWYIKMGLAHN